MTEDRRRRTEDGKTSFVFSIRPPVDRRLSSDSAKQADFLIHPLSSDFRRPTRMGIDVMRDDQAIRAISTGMLNASPRFHTRPINVVVYHGSQGRTRFEVGFPLRCFQWLSRPYIATQHCGWRHNCSTRGTSIPVLSY